MGARRPLTAWKAIGAQTGGEYSLCEVRGPAGFAAPLHRHERENEGFYVASGEVTLVLGDVETRLVEGGFGFAPTGSPIHSGSRRLRRGCSF